MKLPTAPMVVQAGAHVAVPTIVELDMLHPSLAMTRAVYSPR